MMIWSQRTLLIMCHPWGIKTSIRWRSPDPVSIRCPAVSSAHHLLCGQCFCKGKTIMEWKVSISCCLSLAYQVLSKPFPTWIRLRLSLIIKFYYLASGRYCGPGAAAVCVQETRTFWLHFQKSRQYVV